MCYSNASSIMKKKTIFLFLLFLMIYGAVNVDAQVRIGGGSAAHPSAVLDLNSGDAAVATGGLLLPRVRLDSVGDINVFGNVPIEQGLMVYNVNGEGDATRPGTGVYYYDGEKWRFINPEAEYKGLSATRFTIKATHLKSLWLGREGEFTDTLAVTVSDKPDGDRWTIKYTWKARPLDMSETVDLGSDAGDRIIFKQVKNKLKSGKLYAVSCEASVYDYSVECIAGYVVYGVGGWIGHHRWLNVANVNAGGDQNLSRDEQLAVNTRGAYEKDVVGGLFQWGRAADGHEDDKSGTVEGPAVELDSETGTPIGLYKGKFLTAENNSDSSDWRAYPSEKQTEETRKPWYWRTMGNPGVGIDPCDTMPKDYGYMPEGEGDWYVMTREQWNLLQAHNDISYVSTIRTRGISIHPAGSAKPASFLILHSAWRNSNGTLEDVYEGSDGYGDDKINLWFGNLSIDAGPGKADILTVNTNEGKVEGWSAPSVARASGYHIRCVSE